MSPQRKDPVESALTLILDALASTLIPLDITPGRLSEIARKSFVRVGAQHARMRSSDRPHFAKIAALTGLSRAEVKRIVSADNRGARQLSDDLPRSLRVINGWTTSTEYLSRGKPRTLPIEGHAPSFDSLCKTFSGDIPRKVILDDLLRRQRISLDRRRKRVSLIAIEKRSNRQTREHSALAFAAAVMAEALRPDAVVLRRRQKIVTTRELPDGYVETAVAGRLSELLDQMPHLFASKGGRGRHALNAYTLVVRTPAQTTKRRGS
jgi:hypothetical protein